MARMAVAALDRDRRPEVSVVVVVFDMAREAPRTLHSLGSDYQRHVRDTDYEVIVVDNGSSRPLTHEEVTRFGPNFAYHVLPPGDVSPAAAVNYGIARARGDLIGVMVDGARLVTPGLLHMVLLASRLHLRPVIAAPSWHLGPKLQQQSTLEGYDAAAEDELLRSIGWPDDGYRLFDVSVLAASSDGGWFRPLAESNALFVTRELMDELGGVDERFRSPGGGLLNLDLYVRSCALAGSQLILLLGEGSFHQVHGGLTTTGGVNRWEELHQEYVAIRGVPFRHPTAEPLFLGRVPRPSLRFVELSARAAQDAAGQ